MSWDDYTKAILRLDLPSGELQVASGAFGRTVGVFPGDGRTFHIITAHNLAGRLSSADENAAAQARLVARVADTTLEHYPAAGGDRAWTHVEPSVAVVGLDLEQARALGREFGQDAIFEWSPTGLAVVSCTDARAHYTGWVSSPVEDTSATGSAQGHPTAAGDTPAAVPELEPESAVAEGPTPAAAQARTAIPELEPVTRVPELTSQRQGIEKDRVQVNWAAKLERAKIERAAADEVYFRELGTRTGFLFELRDGESDEGQIGVFGTGSTIEVRQTDYPDVLIEDIVNQLPAVLLSRSSADEIVSGGWDAGDIAYTLGGNFDTLYIDDVEWSGGCQLPDLSWVVIPSIGDAPQGCLIATLQIEWHGGSFSPGSDSGPTELLRIGPIFVERGDEWANVLKATTEEDALREFENALSPQEGRETTIFVERPKPTVPAP